MTLAVPLSPDAEVRLKDRARAAGVDATTYAARLLEETLRQPESLLQISGDSLQRFVESGMTEEQLALRLEEEKHAARSARHGTVFRE
ncbi:MAG TPA: hypothetical protein VIL86_18340 [Tepidisphaeraceae bacterium]